ncbi:FkbM family methyltransferase [uncultured Litoreibacter sp.]|uniref:FkbM family methyltransferase n=1 Tax=uncultured Litoreibacter sp. TaxID=1392394 RepID=UPI002630E904|nr:FkbM family methyltransferase [uncultured Litoreibacter sp.]
MAQFELSGVTLEVPEAFLTKRIRMKLKNGGYEGHESRAAQLVVDYGDRVLDLGSGVGYVATLCAMLAGAENVVTVEANPDLLPVIRGNLELNDCEEATVLHGAAVGAPVTGGTLALKQARAFWASSVSDAGGAETIDVPALVLRDLIAEHKPTVVMMDVEGAEATMFDAPWPDHVRVLVMELHPKRYPDTVIKRIFDCMSASGLIYAPALSRGQMIGFCREGVALDAEG